LFAFNDAGSYDVPFWAHAMIWLFVAIGVVLIVVGLKKILVNIATSTKGEETYGIVVDVYPSGTRVNGRPVLNADVEIVESNGMLWRYTEPIGMSYKYRTGNFVRVKHYNNDINILDRIDGSAVPYNFKERLEAEISLGSGQDQYSNICNQCHSNDVYGNQYDVSGTITSDTVVINGVEYTRKK
jgi:hypothetical protein